MNHISKLPPTTLDTATRIDIIASQYEDDCQAGQALPIRDYLEKIDVQARDQLLEELLLVRFELEMRDRGQIDWVAIQQEVREKAETVLRALSRFQIPFSQFASVPETLSERLADRSEKLTPEEPVNTQYKIENEVGRGAMGVVYRAKHRILGMPAAVKIIMPGASGERFLREARILASVNSPHVVRVYDFDQLQDGRQVICMEWVDGTDLQLRIKSSPKGQISLNRGISWMTQTAQGMADVANLGIIHRDLKPSNILIDEKQNARVADFGLARRSQDSTKSFNLSGILLGTPHYISPEQAENPRSADTRSDIYSFGATFYHALTGQVPFDDESVREILIKHKLEPLISPKAHREDLPESICQILERCLSKSPNDRFQTFDELALHLKELSNVEFHWDDVSLDEPLGDHIREFSSRKQAYLTGQYDSDVYSFPSGRVLRVIRGDILSQDVDVIVSSDDSQLSMHGGVSRAVARDAGADYCKEARALAPVRPGRVLVTGSGQLPFKLIFHAITIGYTPFISQFPSRDIIAELINHCFFHADSHDIHSIAFPLIGTGAAGFSREACFDIMFRVIARKLLHGLTSLKEARIVELSPERANLEWRSRMRHRHLRITT